MAGSFHQFLGGVEPDQAKGHGTHRDVINSDTLQELLEKIAREEELQ